MNSLHEESAGRSLWHRAAAASGPNDELASALEVSASDAERRGAIVSAVVTLQKAVELAGDSARRGRLLLRAAELAFELGRRDIVPALLRDADSVGFSPMELARMRWTLSPPHALSA